MKQAMQKSRRYLRIVRNAKSGKLGQDWDKHWYQQVEPMQVSGETGHGVLSSEFSFYYVTTVANALWKPLAIGVIRSWFG